VRPSRPRLGDHSDAEISIEAIDDGEEPPAEPEASGSVVEVIKDSSSQKITMTVDDKSQS
jgi:hypothetical protein